MQIPYVQTPKEFFAFPTIQNNDDRLPPPHLNIDGDKGVSLNEPLPFTPQDQTPQATLFRLLENQGIIDREGHIITEKEISFSFETSQNKQFHEILNSTITVRHFNTTCEFSLRTMLQYLMDQEPVHIKKIDFIGGITRFLVRSSPQFCLSIFKQMQIEIPESLLKDLLLFKSELLPDLDIRFPLESIKQQEEESILDRCRKRVVDFIHSQFWEKSKSYIPNEKIFETSLLKNKTILLNNLSFSIIAFGNTNLQITPSPLHLECLFISRLGKTTHLFSRDNVRIEIDSQTIATDNKKNLSFSSYGNAQLKAILHILLGKIELEHDTDFNGLVRAVSLITNGNTLINPLDSFCQRFSLMIGEHSNPLFFLCDAVDRCLKNHHATTPETFPLFLYNLASVLDEKTRSQYLSSIWFKICSTFEEKESQQPPLCRLMTTLICKHKVSFELIEAVLGVAGLLHLSQTSVKEKFPRTLLCLHGKQIFIQMRITSTIPAFLLIPFSPVKFLETLLRGVSIENEQLLRELFVEAKKLAPTTCDDTSFLEVYYGQFSLVYEALFDRMLEADEHVSTLIKTICNEIETAFQITQVDSKNFLPTLLKTSSLEQRLLLFLRLSQNCAHTTLGKRLKRYQKSWKILLAKEFQPNEVIGLWIQQLIKTKEESFFTTALELCLDYQAYNILSLKFFPNLVPILVSNGFGHAQLLMRMFQQQKRPLLSIKQEFDLIFLMLKKLQGLQGSNVCFPLVAGSLSILEKFVQRYENEQTGLLDFGEIGAKFLERTFYNGFYEASKKLLKQMTLLRLIPASNQIVIDLWVCCYAIESSPKEQPHSISYHFWKDGLKSNIWKNLDNQELYLEAMTKTVEQLSLIQSYQEETMEMLQRFTLYPKQWGLLWKRVGAVTKEILLKQFRVTQTEKSLKYAINQLKTLKKHLGPDAKHEILCSLFEQALPLKLWDRIFKIWATLIHAQKEDSKETLRLTKGFCESLLKNNQFQILITVLKNPLMVSFFSGLNEVWTAYPLTSFKFLAVYTHQICQDWQISISSRALEGVYKLNPKEQFEFFSKKEYAVFLDKQKISQQVGESIQQILSIEKSPRILEQCLHLLSDSLPMDLNIWSAVFISLDRFSNPQLVWETFQLGPMRSEDIKDRPLILKCWQGLLLCLKNNNSPLLLTCMKEFICKGSKLRPFFFPSPLLQINLELICICVELITYFHKQGCLNSEESIKTLLWIQKKIEGVSILEVGQSPLKFIHNYIFSHFIALENYHLFCYTSDNLLVLLKTDANLISEKVVLQLFSQGKKWELKKQFLEEKWHLNLLKIAKLFMNSASTSRLQKIASVISHYEFPWALLLTKDLIIRLLCGKSLTTNEILHYYTDQKQDRDHINISILPSSQKISSASSTTNHLELGEYIQLRLDTNTRLLFPKQQKKTSPQQISDTKLGKILVRYIKQVLNQRVPDLMTVTFLLKHPEIKKHCSLQSIDALSHLHIDTEDNYCGVRQSYTDHKMKMRSLVQYASWFVSVPELFNPWKKKLLNYISPFLAEKNLCPLFFSGISHLLLDLKYEECKQTISFTRLQDSNEVTCVVEFAETAEKNLKITKKQIAMCDELFDIFDAVLKCENIPKSRTAQLFIFKNLSSILLAIYKNKLSINTTRLEKILNRCIDTFPANTIMGDFACKFTPDYFLLIRFQELMVNLTKRLVTTVDIESFSKGILFMHIFYVKHEKDDPFFTRETVKDLYDNATDTLLKLLSIETSFENIKRAFDYLRELFLVQEKKMNFLGSNNHVSLMHDCSRTFVTKLIPLIPSLVRPDCDIFNLAYFAAFCLSDLTSLKDPSSNFDYKEHVKQIVCIIIPKIHFLEDYTTNEELVKSCHCISLIIGTAFDLDLSPKPDVSLITIAIDWIKALQSCLALREIGEEQELSFKQFIEEKYFNEITSDFWKTINKK